MDTLTLALIFGAALLLLSNASGEPNWDGRAEAAEGDEEGNAEPPETDQDRIAAESIGLTPAVRSKILKILAQTESSQNYGEIYIDVGSKEFSYGLLQTTLGSGGLGRLIQQYILSAWQYASQLQSYLPKLTSSSPNDSFDELSQDAAFKSLLKQAAQDPTMQQAQDRYFDQSFLSRAYKWATDRQFRYPVSYLTIADTFIQSGGPSAITKWAKMTTFPKDGEEEGQWLTQYLNWRIQWLKNKSPLLARTAHRPERYLRLLQSDPNLQGTVDVQGTMISGYAGLSGYLHGYRYSQTWQTYYPIDPKFR